MKSLSAAGVAAFGVAALSGLLAATMKNDVGFPRIELAAYSTSFRGRTTSQRHNAKLAAAALDRAMVGPNEVFSFNRRVGVWDLTRGYVKAPVSYEGLFLEAVGGGVCQVSTTLYNAVLLAGLPIVERHPHAVAPAYVPPGRDAAVAQYALDFRFRNNLPGPVLVHTETVGSRLTIRLYGTVKKRGTVRVLSDILGVVSGHACSRYNPHVAPSRPQARQHATYGIPGYDIVTYRETITPEGTVRERLSEDRYKPVHYLAGPSRQLSDGWNSVAVTDFRRDWR